MNAPFDRISIDPDQMNGQPCIRGMRLTVRRVVEAAALYPDRDELKRNPRARSATLRTGRRTSAPAKAPDRAALGLPKIVKDGV